MGLDLDIGKEIVNGLRDAFMKPFKPIIDRGNRIGSAAKSLGNRFKQAIPDINNIFISIGDAIKNDIAGTVEVAKNTTNNFEDIMVTLFAFLTSNLECGIKLIKNFHICYMYYAWNMILELVFLPFNAFNYWLIVTFNLNLFFYTVTPLWKLIVDLDCITFPYLKWSYTHWSEEIQDLCYNCCRVKKEAITRKAKEFSQYVHVGAPKYLSDINNKNNANIRRAGNKVGDDFNGMKKDFNDMFYNIWHLFG